MTFARLLKIRGKVQGVSYRDSLRREANRLGVCGWVRNRSDGAVEAFVQGNAQQVEDLLQWARLGPPAARVDDLTSESAAPDPALKTFEQRETF